MSNSKVRKAIEAKEKKSKSYEDYKKVECLLTNYQMCKAYFRDSSASVLGVVELILKEKYNLPWQSKLIRIATMAARGKKNALIAIPQFKYSENVDNILSKFVRKKFDLMAIDRCTNNMYPFIFRTILEKNS